jgi:hypothetical protein
MLLLVLVGLKRGRNEIARTSVIFNPNLFPINLGQAPAGWVIQPPGLEVEAVCGLTGS